MQYCPTCTEELSERAIFCSSCGVQARCKTCKDVLDLNARFCVSCGTLVGEGKTIAREHTDRLDRDAQRNIIEFSEDGKSRRFRAEVSDVAINSVSNPLSLFLGSRIVKQTNRGQRQVSGVDDTIIESGDSGRDFEDDFHPTIEGAKALPVSSDRDILQRIFRRTNDNKLKLTDSRLKQDSQKDFVRRLSVLFLLAHELEGQESVSRDDLTAVLTDARIYDGNARTWISNTELIDKEEDSVRLSLPGHDHARKVLGEYLDPQIEGKWSVESRSKRRTNKGRIGERDDESTEVNKTTRNRRSRGDSYTAKVKMLFEEGFFVDGRKSDEVQTELQRQGYKFELKRIKEALVGLTQKKKLTRNENESKEWIYKNA